jgi:hypothetical protein
MKPLVWMVDDLRENREKFKEAQKQHFTVRVFESPNEVLAALESEKSPPDALLCDIYFFDDVSKAQDAEEKVQRVAEQLDKLAKDLGAEKNQTGILLVEAVRRMFKDSPPFPIYAYTAKGPYLLQGSGFDQLSYLEARWLFKNKYNSQSESLIIKRGIGEFKELYSLRKRAWSWSKIIGLNILSAMFGAALSWLLGHLFDGFIK